MENIPVNSSEYIYQCLKEEILHLKLKPGQPISENGLCSRFAVSRTPIRSVLQRLSGERLINVVPYKGSFVSLLNFNDIEQIIYMRIAVENAVLHDFLPLCTPLLEEKLRYIVRKQMVLMEDKNLEMSRFYELDSQFHEVWFKTAGHEMLWQLIQKSEVDYTRFRMLDIVAAQNLPVIIEEHRELFQLIHEGRAEGIQPLIEKHLNGGIRRLQSRIHAELQDYFQPEPGGNE